jgi:hypothetical protein
VLVTALFISISSLSYAACSQTGNDLNGLVGLDSSNGVIYTNLSSNENQCSCTYARFNPVNTDTKMEMSVLLAAKLAEKKYEWILKRTITVIQLIVLIFSNLIISYILCFFE